MHQIQISNMTYDVLVHFLENECHLDMATWRFRSETFRKYYRTMDRIIEKGIKALYEEMGMDAILDAQEGGA